MSLAKTEADVRVHIQGSVVFKGSRPPQCSRMFLQKKEENKKYLCIFGKNLRELKYGGDKEADVELGVTAGCFSITSLDVP